MGELAIERVQVSTVSTQTTRSHLSLADAMYPTKPLLDAVGVPWQVVVDQEVRPQVRLMASPVASVPIRIMQSLFSVKCYCITRRSSLAIRPGMPPLPR